MLHVLRRHKNSKLVWVGLALISGVFVFWGIGAGIGGETVNTVATVNGRPIDLMQLQRAEANLLDAYRNALKDQFTPEMRKNLNLRQRALDTLIDREILVGRAESLGITVSDQELADSIAANPAFQVNGRFSKEAYLRAIRYVSFSPAEFETAMRKDLSIDRLESAVAGGVAVSEAAARDEILAKDQKVQLAYVRVRASDFTMSVAVDDDELRKQYENHRDRYVDPERVRVELIVYPAEKFATAAAPTDEEVQAYYDEHLADSFTQQHEVRARHILIKAPESADPQTRAEARKQIEELEKQVKAGADFEKLARERSQDEGSAKEGGDLGFFGKGRMVKPFEEAAFALSPGSVSEIVETPFGFHLIRVEEVREEREKPLSEVREEIVKALGDERAKAAAKAAAEADQAAWQGGKPAAEIASARGLTVEQPDPLQRNDSIPSVGRSFPLMSDLFALQPGGVGTPVQVGDKWVVARLVEKIPPTPKEYEAVKAQVETAYRLDEGSKMAKERAVQLLDKAKAAGSLEGVAAAEKVEVKTTDPFPRAGAYVQGIGGSQELKDKAFALTETARLGSEAVQVAGDWYVFELAKIETPSDEEIAKKLPEVRKQMLEARRQNVFGRYLAELKKSSSISVDAQKLESMPVA
jgi:peptidyl-prolyl cis-trans isomerase D